MSNFEHFLSTKKVYLKKLTKKIIFNELLYNCISSIVIYIKKPSIWWPEKYFSHDKMQFFGIFRNYEIKYCFWSFGNTIEILVIIGRRVSTMTVSQIRKKTAFWKKNLFSHCLYIPSVQQTALLVFLWSITIPQHSSLSKGKVLYWQSHGWLTENDGRSPPDE